MTVDIRPISESDSFSFHMTLAEMAEEQRFPALPAAPSLPAITAQLKAHIEADQVHFVAFSEKKIVGWCDIIARSTPGTTHEGYLSIGVLANFRRKGLGLKLLQTALEAAWTRGLSRVELQVSASNKAAQNCFAKAGFQFEGRRRQAHLVDGRWQDSILMSRLKPTHQESYPQAAVSPIIARIERGTGIPGLAAILTNELPGTDLQSLLLAVCQARCVIRTPSQVLRDFDANRFVEPAKVAAVVQNEWERLVLINLPDRVEPVILSPLCPLGTNSVVADVDQDWAVATIRNTVVVSDPTNVLALECAQRRRQALRKAPKSAAPVHLSAFHRVVRPQWINLPGFVPHFHLCTMVGAGRDRGGLQFQLETLRMQLTTYLSALATFLGTGTRYRISVTNLGSAQRNSVIETDLLIPLSNLPVTPLCRFDPDRVSGRSYYRDLCFKLHVSREAQEWIEIGDGGCVDWTAKLLSNKKETLVISGLGGERIFWFREQACSS